MTDNPLEKLINAKRAELEDEKRRLGLTGHQENDTDLIFPTSPKPAADNLTDSKKHVQFEKKIDSAYVEENTENIAPELLKYIRRYAGLPTAMLKTGEFSPNNPLFRAAPGEGHELFPGLGAYEERAKSLRRQRCEQYRNTLQQQAKQAESRTKVASRRTHAHNTECTQTQHNGTESSIRDAGTQSSPRLHTEIHHRDDRSRSIHGTDMVSSHSHSMCARGTERRECSTQCDLIARSKAVQTEDFVVEELPSRRIASLTRAERELSPRTVRETSPRTVRETSPRTVRDTSPRTVRETSPRTVRETHDERATFGYRRKSYDQALIERQSNEVARTCREKLVRDLRHSYLPSFLDADTIRQRNLKAQQEAAERRRFYQEELRNQIAEQRRIREERKAREQMLEAAEMRRLEEQLRMLKVAQQEEGRQHNRLSMKIVENSADFNREKGKLQKDIVELTSYRQPLRKSNLPSSRSENSLKPSQLPLYYSTHCLDRSDKPYSTNIPQNSLFSPDLDLEDYLRRSLNPAPATERLKSTEYVPTFLHNEARDEDSKLECREFVKCKEDALRNLGDKEDTTKRNPEMGGREKEEIRVENNGKTDKENYDSLPIPVLRHKTSPKINVTSPEKENVSEAMRKLEAKWSVPIVQRNIVRSIPSSDGQSKILTQLGSIRRQLQLEQLKLDNMLGQPK